MGNLRTFAQIISAFEEMEINEELEKMECKGKQKAASVNKVSSRFSCLCCFHPEHGVKNCPFRKGSGYWCLFCLNSKHWSSRCNQQKKANAYNVELDEDKTDDEVRYCYNIETDGEDGPDLIFDDDNESVRSDELDW